MNTKQKMTAIAAMLLLCGAAAAKDTSPLARVSPVQDAQYAYRPVNSGGAESANRVIMDKLNRAVAVVDSNLDAGLKRAAMQDLIEINHPLATRALASLLRQAEKSGDVLVMREVANAVWYHAAQLEFRDKAANAMIGTMRTSQNQVVRSVGAQALNDQNNYIRKTD